MLSRAARFSIATTALAVLAAPARADDSVSRLYGVTIANVENLPPTLDALRSLSQRPTARIVFDEYVSASAYAAAVRRIHTVAGTMGEILDSQSVPLYAPGAYASRVREYVDALRNDVDIWEVGNEVNGEWLGATADVVTKIATAYDYVKQTGGRSALTLYYNQDCWADAGHEMFTWADANIPSRMKSGLDYVLVSYYEDDCNGLRPDWQPVFDRLGQMFPTAKIGFGEVGTTDPAKKIDFIRRYYGLQIDHPRYVGGYFWWYFLEDMVPAAGNRYWNALNQALSLRPTTP
jgi:hypothetical protein